jgi:hypothetical protein
MGLFRKRQPPAVDQALRDLLVTEDDIRADRALELRHLAHWQPQILEVLAELQQGEVPQMLSVGYQLNLIGLVDEDCRAGVLLATSQRSFEFDELASGKGRLLEIDHADLVEIECKRDPGPPDKRVTRVCMHGSAEAFSHPMLTMDSAERLRGTVERLR